mmetsp:Transcript_19898/g.60361  ORF Transcript_19898/g.60361 Transcript_19898/m.60361 type:complete len:1122 (+) Transcript_19898:164-3529(+)
MWKHSTLSQIKTLGSRKENTNGCPESRAAPLISKPDGYERPKTQSSTIRGKSGERCSLGGEVTGLLPPAKQPRLDFHEPPARTPPLCVPSCSQSSQKSTSSLGGGEGLSGAGRQCPRCFVAEKVKVGLFDCGAGCKLSCDDELISWVTKQPIEGYGYPTLRIRAQDIKNAIFPSEHNKFVAYIIGAVEPQIILQDFFDPTAIQGEKRIVQFIFSSGHTRADFTRAVPRLREFNHKNQNGPEFAMAASHASEGRVPREYLRFASSHRRPGSSAQKSQSRGREQVLRANAGRVNQPSPTTSFQQLPAQYGKKREHASSHLTWENVDADEYDEVKEVTRDGSDKSQSMQPVRRSKRRLPSDEIFSEISDRPRNLTATVLVYPNDQSKDAITLTKEELWRLSHNEFLNDSLVDFYLKFIQDRMKRDAPDVLEKCHFFNSFFYKRLLQTMGKKPGGGNGNDRREAYKLVRRWTKTDLFSKEYIFVPINESLHWSLVIICRPGEYVEKRMLSQEAVSLHRPGELAPLADGSPTVRPALTDDLAYRDELGLLANGLAEAPGDARSRVEMRKMGPLSDGEKTDVDEESMGGEELLAERVHRTCLDPEELESIDDTHTEGDEPPKSHAIETGCLEQLYPVGHHAISPSVRSGESDSDTDVEDVDDWQARRRGTIEGGGGGPRGVVDEDLFAFSEETAPHRARPHFDRRRRRSDLPRQDSNIELSSPFHTSSGDPKVPRRRRSGTSIDCTDESSPCALEKSGLPSFKSASNPRETVDISEDSAEMRGHFGGAGTSGWRASVGQDLPPPPAEPERTRPHACHRRAGEQVHEREGQVLAEGDSFPSVSSSPVCREAPTPVIELDSPTTPARPHKNEEDAHFPQESVALEDGPFSASCNHREELIGGAIDSSTRHSPSEEEDPEFHSQVDRHVVSGPTEWKPRGAPDPPLSQNALRSPTSSRGADTSVPSFDSNSHPSELMMGQRSCVLEDKFNEGKIPCILYLDSLGGTKEHALNLLKFYLEEEWKDKARGQAELEDPKFRCMTSKNVRVRIQHNHSDCGLYMLKYIENFARYGSTLEPPLEGIPEMPNWDAYDKLRFNKEDVVKLRREMHCAISEMGIAQQRQGEIERKVSS